MSNETSVMYYDGLEMVVTHGPDGTSVARYVGDVEDLPEGSIIEMHLLGDKFHRVGGPAITYAGGSKEWLQHGKLHNEDGPAITCPSGEEAYYIDDKESRLDGPAVIREDGTLEWLIDGIRHNEEGPAIVWPNGCRDYYINGVFIRREEAE